jgi:hypothetical protein
MVFVLALPIAAIAADWTIGFDRIGKVKIGTALSDIGIPIEQPLQKTVYRDDGFCFYVFPEHKEGIALMIEDGVLTRIDVMKRGAGTIAGVEVGDAVAKVRKAYGRALKEEPRDYDDREKYLTVSSKDGRHLIRFLTNHGKIEAIISGNAKSVRYMEGCL